MYSTDTELASWTSLSVPGDVVRFGLGTYHSQLVLAGGWISSAKKCVTDVWASDGGTSWQQSESLPPLSMACSMPAIINTGSPEYLLVAGGYDSNLEPLVRVDVLIEKQWVSLCPNHLVAYNSQQESLCFRKQCRFCLLLQTRLPASYLFPGKNQHNTIMESPFPAHCIASYGQQLLVLKCPDPAGKVFAYSPLTQSWVHVCGGLP